MTTSIDFYSFTFIPLCDFGLILRSHRRIEYLISVTYKITGKVIWVGFAYMYSFFILFISRLKVQGENWCSFRLYLCDSDFSNLSDAFEACMVISFRSYALLCQFDSEWLWGPNFNYEMVSEKLNWFYYFLFWQCLAYQTQLNCNMLVWWKRTCTF